MKRVVLGLMLPLSIFRLAQEAQAERRRTLIFMI